MVRFKSILFCRMIYSTAPIPLMTAPSFVLINLSSGRGTAMDLNPCSADCAREKIVVDRLTSRYVR